MWVIRKRTVAQHCLFSSCEVRKEDCRYEGERRAYLFAVFFFFLLCVGTLRKRVLALDVIKENSSVVKLQTEASVWKECVYRGRKIRAVVKILH